MYVAKGHLTLIKTNFNSQSHLAHKVINVANEVGDLSSSNVVEFSESGLIFSGSNDDYSTDLIFATCTDESAPCMVNDTIIGGNHGMPCAINVYCENHNKTIKDVGAIYKDENGVKFVLVKVLDSSRLVFVSKNATDKCFSSEFTKKITGVLTYEENGNDTKEVKLLTQYCGFLYRSNRYLKKDLTVYKNGEKINSFGGAKDCDLVKITEEYLVINPASCVNELAEKRPKDGYQGIIDISNFGSALIDYKVNHLVHSDGTIVVEFNHKKLQDFTWKSQMGIMSQTKFNVYGGGVYRYIPKTKPLFDDEGVYDLTKPSPIYPLTDKLLPKRLELKSEFWKDKNSPPDRVVEYFKDKDGNDKLCYACGYLPLFDCEPKYRAKNVTSAFTVVSSRKVYPNVKDGDFDSVKGVGYKKYFEPIENGISRYVVNYQGKNFIYFDFFKKGKCDYLVNGDIELLEKSDDVEYEIKDGKLVVTSVKDGCSNYATFIEKV